MSTLEQLLKEFADAYREGRILKGIEDYNQDQVVAYAVESLVVEAKHSGAKMLDYIKAEVEWQKECNERFRQGKFKMGDK
ncbi:hypothetical protein [Ralstonia phage RSP15]|uniref:hypothetical protein n=1 Tax=Ralstonia phage RSP15 TaxID=1785960 RepID=UPI00074D3718|nr:hypothetical protein BH754_gp052 [Ralstonia phage RSP15]BAU40010.1 hypothetical protein [Ralstonia phage RSP15]